MLATVPLLLLSILIAISSFTASPVLAQGPENTILVVNAKSADSLAVANLYIRLRKIPATNVIYLSGNSLKEESPESTSSKWFLKVVWKPVSKAIKDRGLTDQITCLTYSAGFPTRVSFKPKMEEYLAATGKKYSRVQHAPWASISSLTYFHENAYSESETPTFLEPKANRYGNQRPDNILKNPFEGEDGKQYDTAEISLKTQDYSNAVAILHKLVEKHPNQVPVIYALARASAFNGDGPAAIELLREAQAKGFAYRSLIEQDRCFDTVKSNQDFTSILLKMEDLTNSVFPTRGFPGNSYWSKNGWPCSTPEQGDRYLLSTVLAVTGENRSTLEQALAQIERSVAADGTHPKGDVYFAKHNDPRSRTRHSQFDFAATELKSLGRSAIIAEKRLPKNNSRVVGATLGSAAIDWDSTGCQFAPGALCDNFTSHGAWWGNENQTQLSDFLSAGAAGAWGTVCEPYTIWWKIPNARLHAHYGRGCTLAESFYQSISGPFQALIAGDPLCCPFGDFPEFNVTGLEQDSIIKSDFTLRIKAASSSPKIRHYEIYYDGVLTSKVKKAAKIQIAIDAMSDGFHELRIVGVADTPTANRTSKQLGFVIDRKQQNVSLVVASKKVPIERSLTLTSTATTGGQIQILQNSRVIASFNSSEIVKIEASKLGLGKTKLKAITTTSDGSVVASSPVAIEITR